MDFDLDPEEDAKVRAGRGFGLLAAAAIFNARVFEKEDTRCRYGEVRMIATGEAGGTFYAAVYTDRGPVRHIITAWPSNRKERTAWHDLA